MDAHVIRWLPIGHRSCYPAIVQRTSGTFNFSAAFAPQIRAGPLARNDLVCQFHRRAHRGIQEEVTMLELFIIAGGFAGGYAASVYSWPQIRVSAIGFTAEINQLRARAKLLEDQVREAAKGDV
jgi:hypothetical protein